MIEKWFNIKKHYVQYFKLLIENEYVRWEIITNTIACSTTTKCILIHGSCLLSNLRTFPRLWRKNNKNLFCTVHDHCCLYSVFFAKVILLVLLIDSPLLYCILQGMSIIQGLTSSCYVNNCFLQCLAAKIYLLMNLSTWESNNRFRWEMVAIIILRYESSIYVNASASTMNGFFKKYGERIIKKGIQPEIA